MPIYGATVTDHSALPAPDEPLPGIPVGDRVAWCAVCGYSVAFDDATADTYGVEWLAVLTEMFDHAH